MSRRRTGRAVINRQRRDRLLRQLRVRDGDDCRWCLQPIDFDLPREDPMAWTFDHIRPHTDGGTYARDNLQLMHGTCNHLEGRWEQLARKWRSE